MKPLPSPQPPRAAISTGAADLESSGLLAEWAKASGLALSPGQAAQLESYLGALYLANQTMNLTRIPREEAVVKHLIDSLLPHRLFPIGSSVVDLGTGPGLPAWPLACARPDLKVVAVDSTAKAVEFLRSMPLAGLSVLLQRAEEGVRREAFDVATGRAFAPLGIQLEASAPWVKVGGIVAPYRTAAEEEECRAFVHGQLGLELEDLIHLDLPGGAGRRLFPIYRKIRPTPMEFPRPWARMKKNPLKSRP